MSIPTGSPLVFWSRNNATVLQEIYLALFNDESSHWTCRLQSLRSFIVLLIVLVVFMFVDRDSSTLSSDVKVSCAWLHLCFKAKTLSTLIFLKTAQERKTRWPFFFLLTSQLRWISSWWASQFRFCSRWWNWSHQQDRPGVVGSTCVICSLFFVVVYNINDQLSEAWLETNVSGYYPST